MDRFIGIAFTVLVGLACSMGIDPEYKYGLISFDYYPWNIPQEKLQNPDSLGSLWVAASQFNMTRSGDTIKVSVNYYLPVNHEYDGGYDFRGDTLILYARTLNPEVIPVYQDFRILNHCILANNREANEIKFLYW